MDLAYRLLGLLVLARFQIALLVAIAVGVLLLAEVRVALDDPVGPGLLGLLDSPLLLLVATWLLAQLPPGVVFWRTPIPDPTAVTTDDGDEEEDCNQWGCRASGRFRASETAEWRLLVTGTLQVTPWGGVQVSAPNFTPRGRWRGVTPLGVRTLDWYRPFALRPPLWGADPLPMQWQRRRRREVTEPEPSAETASRLAILAHDRRAVVPGWQYSALRRYPAIRLAHRGDGERDQYTYLAFASVRTRDLVLARLTAPPASSQHGRAPAARPLSRGAD